MPPPLWFRRFGLACAALAMFSLAGGHWAALQAVAWAGMLRDYSARSGSLLAGAAQTFDGKHPCGLCERIASAKAWEKAPDPARKPASPGKADKTDKTDKACAPEDSPRPARRPADRLTYPALACSAAPSRAEEPPTPPPRVG